MQIEVPYTDGMEMYGFELGLGQQGRLGDMVKF